jgi:AmiR/NasT family two-component response regulator
VTDGESFLALAGLAARETVQLIPDAQWVGVTTRFAGAPFTAAHTHPVVLVVDAAQYAQGDGPCLTAMRTNREVATTVAAGRSRWPQLTAAAADAGVRSFLAQPLHAHGRVVGSLNLYSARARGLRTADPEQLTVLTDALDRGLNDYWNTRTETDRATRLQNTLRRDWVINQAIGMLMAAQDLAAPDASAVLRQQAGKAGVPLHQAAQEIINQHPHRTP